MHHFCCAKFVKELLKGMLELIWNLLEIVWWCVQDFNQVIRHVLSLMFECNVNQLNLDGSITDCVQSENKRRKWVHPGLCDCHIVLESQKAFYIVQPFMQHTLLDVLSFSPARLGKDENRKLFLVYQLLQTFRWCHDRGIPVGVISWRDVFVDDQLWIRINAPQPEALYRHNQALSKQTNSVMNTEADQVVTNSTKALEVALLDWMEGRMSNFDYLMMLNELAGRNKNDPEHYPVIPWVTDFSSPEGNMRDLRLSKFRLCKGDKQLDITFNFSASMLPGIEALGTPHHVTDFLSSVTYYVYKARRTSKSLLCRYVRSKWVPDEYPASMQRMQQWTPDECIPDFFTDPSIFSSIHVDLPDIVLPAWVQSGEEFIAYHRNLLEGEYVSQNLHHWIDLTFGYKVSKS